MMADPPPEDVPKDKLSFVDNHGPPSCSIPTVNKEKPPPPIDDQRVAASSVISSNATSNVDLTQVQSFKKDIKKQNDPSLKNFQLENISSEENGNKCSQDVDNLVSEDSFVRQLNVTDETYATSLDYSSIDDQLDKKLNMLTTFIELQNDDNFEVAANGDSVEEGEFNESEKDHKKKEHELVNDVEDDDGPEFIPQAKIKLTLPPETPKMRYSFYPPPSLKSISELTPNSTSENQTTRIDYREILAKKNSKNKQSTIVSKKSVNSSKKKGTNKKNKGISKIVKVNLPFPNSNTNLTSFKVISSQCIVDNCNMQFPDDEQFMRHLLKTHDIWIYRCFLPKCDQTFATKSGLENHFNVNHPNTVQWQCSKCPTKLGTSLKLFNHTVNNHYKGHFVCASCPFSGPSRQIIMSHFAKMHTKNLQKRNKNSDRIPIPPPPPPPPPPSSWPSFNNPGKRSFSPMFPEPYVPTQKMLKTSTSLSTNDAPVSPSDYDYRGASMSNEWNYHSSGHNRGSSSSPFADHTLNASNSNAFWSAQASSSAGNFYPPQSRGYPPYPPPFPMNYDYRYARPAAPPPPTSTASGDQQTSGSTNTPAYNPWAFPAPSSTQRFNDYKYYGYDYGRY